MAGPTPPPEPQRVASHEDLKGHYANVVSVSASAHDFTLDFYRMDPSSPGQVILVTRVTLSHLCAGQFSEILSKQWAAYAARSFPPEVTDVLSTGQPPGSPPPPTADPEPGNDDDAGP